MSEYELKENLEFILYNFHDYFDGILGIRDLRKLKLNIDLNNRCLVNETCVIPLFYREDFNLQKIEIPPNSIILKQINTDLEDNTDLLMPHINNKIIEILPCILKVKDSTVPLEIRNLTNDSVIMHFYPNTIRQKAEIFQAESFEIFNIEQILDFHQNENFQNFSELNFITSSDFDLSNNNDKPDDFSLIRSKHLNQEEKYELKKLILQYPEILHRPNDKLTFTSNIKHDIKTTDEIPIYTKSYRYPYIHKEEVQRQITKMLEDGIIRPSCSPWSAPVWIVPKKIDASGKQKWRIVTDYRKLNLKTIDDRYPLPNISDILDKLGRSQYFTTLDLASGFHQIEVHPDSIPKTAFSVENGHYEYVRMPFGLKNAPATFQRVMDNVLKDLLNKICLVYMDDIIIFSTSLQEHICNLKQVFKKLKDHNLKIQLDKCEFLCKSVEFLGHVITTDGIKPNPKKIEVIKTFPIPRNPKEIKSFLGLIGYYRKFIKNFAQLTKPMTNCLKKDKEVVHNQEFINCFETCKKILTNDPILQHPDFSKPFVLTTDASNYAVGAILSQGPIGKDLPIAYASRTLNPAEINYSTIEKELLAIVWATKYFRPYLFGTKFKIVSDHKPLQWLFSIKEPNSKLVRWRLKLEEFDYEIIYKQGKNNTNADALSRIQIHAIENEKEEDNMSLFPNYDSDDLPHLSNTDLDEILLYLNNDTEPKIKILSDITITPEMNKSSTSQEIKTSLKKQHLKKNENDDLETIHSSLEDPIIGAPYIKKPLNIFKNQIIFRYANNNQIKIQKEKIFDKLRTFIFLPNDPDEEIICKIIKEHFIPKLTYCMFFQNKNLEPIVLRIFQKYFKNGSFILYISDTFLEDVTEKDTQQEKIKLYHETKTSHRGITENIASIKKVFYWPNLEIDVKTYINLCEICQHSKYERHPHKIVFKPTPIGYEPFDHIYIDTFKTHNTYFLTIVDSFSKMGQAYPLNTQTSTEILDKLIIYFNHYGIPRKITSDNSRTFKNENLQNLCSLHKIEMHYCTPRNPNSNSPIERLHSTLQETIITLKNKDKNANITQLMNYAILSYNNSTHSALKYTPFQIIKGKLDFRNPIELSEEQIITNYMQEHSENIRTINKQIYDSLTLQQKNILDKRNETRQENIQIDPEKPLYEKRFSQDIKTKNKYEQVKKPLIIHENVVTQKNRKIHKRNLKPQRFFVSDGEAPSSSSNATNSGNNRSKGNKKSNTSRILRSRVHK